MSDREFELTKDVSAFRPNFSNEQLDWQFLYQPDFYHCFSLPKIQKSISSNGKNNKLICFPSGIQKSSLRNIYFRKLTWGLSNITAATAKNFKKGIFTMFTMFLGWKFGKAPQINSFSSFAKKNSI